MTNLRKLRLIPEIGAICRKYFEEDNKLSILINWCPSTSSCSTSHANIFNREIVALHTRLNIEGILCKKRKKKNRKLFQFKCCRTLLLLVEQVKFSDWCG